MRETYALLMAGNEPRFHANVSIFKDFLLKELDFDPARVKKVAKTESPELEAVGFFMRMAAERKPSDVVVLYAGHGVTNGFFPNGMGLPYDILAKILTEHHGRFFYINDACYSGGLITPLTKMGLLPEKGLVIASSMDDELTYGGLFLRRLMDSYRENKVFRRKKIGSEESIGKVVINLARSDDSETEYDEEGNETLKVDSLEPKVTYKRPKILGKTQHPVRRGRTLDQLLFKDPSADALAKLTFISR